MRPPAPSAALAVLLMLGWPLAAAGKSRDVSRADLLHQRGLQRLAGATADSQRAGLADLEEAARIAPRRLDIGFALGRACLELGRVGRARACLTRITRMGADDHDAWLALATAWKRDWLYSLERPSLEQALRCAQRAAKADPESRDAWVAAACLDLLLGRAADGLAAASAALRLDPEGADPALVLASAWYRSGNLSRAEALFRQAREDSRESWDGSFAWEGSDPDRTTPENEAELDARTRWTLARFLFRDGDQVKWDRRAELFVRYGPPAAIEYDPAWAQVGEQELAFAYPRHAHVMYAPDPIPDPYHMQVWHYPDLGFDAILWDRFLNQSYDFPYANDRSLDPRPDSSALAGRTDLLSMDGGRGVFRALPPGAEPLSLRAAVHRFPFEDGSRLVAHLFAPAGPEENRVGSWAVVDGRGRVVHTASGPLSVSSCDPGAEKVAQFEASLPPGDYRVDVAVADGARRRGIAHLGVRIRPPTPTLSMSDLVLLCGQAPTGGDAVRIEPDVERRIARGGPVILYYELEHLSLAASGSSRFSYTCTVRQLARGGKALRDPAIAYQATREEENVGAHRRQFVTIPSAVLGDGVYEVRMEVRDLGSGQEATASIRFTRGGLEGLAETRR